MREEGWVPGMSERRFQLVLVAQPFTRSLPAEFTVWHDTNLYNFTFFGLHEVNLLNFFWDGYWRP